MARGIGFEYTSNKYKRKLKEANYNKQTGESENAYLPRTYQKTINLHLPNI